MPTLKPGFPADATYDIQVDKFNLLNRHQYDGAVETITYRMIRPFGLQAFVLSVAHFMARANRNIKATDMRRKEVKRLQAAREALYNAAHEYDEAVAAVESLTQKSRG